MVMYVITCYCPFQCKADAPDINYFKWEKKPVPEDDVDNDEKDHFQYSWLVAHNLNPSLVSPAYLTFKELDGPPTIQSTTNPTKFLISYQTTNQLSRHFIMNYLLTFN